MHRVWDVSYDGYVNGKGVSIMDWSATDIENFKANQQETGTDYDGKDIVAIPMNLQAPYLPSPMPYKAFSENNAPQYVTDDLNVEDMNTFYEKFKQKASFTEQNKDHFEKVLKAVNSKINIISNLQESRSAAAAAMSNESTLCRMFYQGTVKYKPKVDLDYITITGCGHHGPDYTGVASVRNGKTLMATAAPSINTISVK